MQILSNDSGIIRKLGYDASEDRVIIKSEQDVDPILAMNKELQKDKSLTRSKSGELRYVAQIPNIVIEKWLKEEGLNIFNKDHWEKIKLKLNDSEYQYLRTDLSNI